jgi:hypothetical protein
MKSPQIVMPDLIRHPEHIELPGFRPMNDVGSPTNDIGSPTNDIGSLSPE